MFTNSCRLAFVLLLCGIVLGQKEPRIAQLQPEHHDCPTWTYFDNETQSCKCGPAVHKIIICSIIDGNISEVGVLLRFCMTQNKEKTKVVVGPCPYYNIIAQVQEDVFCNIFIPVPSDVAKLDKGMCGYTSRTGQLCGQCEEGHSPPVYSYYPQCVNCTAGTNNWPKYMAVSLLPTTVFLIGVLVFRFRATSPLLNGYILVCQIIASPPLQRLIARHIYEEQYENTYIGSSGFIYSGCLDIWNLNFFRLAYTPFCLHPNTSTLQVLSLDYIIATYPLALIILTYTLVRLHYHNCRLVVWLWKPFISCFARCRRQWDIQNSLVDAFATFLLLSYVKYLSVSFDILMPTFSWDAELKLQPPVLYYDGTVEYFGKDLVHFPYALLSLAVLFVFTFLPILLLCLYPCRCFQRFLNRYHLSSPALHTFMDTFQGGFKDGTNGTRDCRYFAAFYLIFRVIIYLSLGISIVTFNTSMMNCILLVAVVALSIFQPYKDSLYNKLDICFLVLLMAMVSCVYIFQTHATWLERAIDTDFEFLLLPIPLLYPLCLASHHVWKNSMRLQMAITRIKVAFFQRQEVPQQIEASLQQREPMTEATALLAAED